MEFSGSREINNHRRSVIATTNAFIINSMLTRDFSPHDRTYYLRVDVDLGFLRDRRSGFVWCRLFTIGKIWGNVRSRDKKTLVLIEPKYSLTLPVYLFIGKRV